jgi:cardiolipin synthase A/B
LSTKSVISVGLIGLMLIPFTAAQPADTEPLQDIFLSLVYDNAGQNSIPALNLVRAAKTSIDIEIYEIKDPTFLNAVLDAAKRSVRVRIIKDPNPVANVGPDGVTLSCEWFNPDTAHDEPGCATQRAFIENVRVLGAQIVPFNKAQLCDKDATSPKPTCYQHGKLIIADRKRALISTGNFNPDNLCDLPQNPAKCNRDFSVVTADNDVLRTVQRVFDNDLTGKRYALESIVTGAIQQKLTVSPYSFAPIEGLIRSAKTRLQIENQYLKHPQINRAIQSAARRGVRVEISLANLCEFGVPNATATKQATDLLTPFDQAGASVRMFTPSITVKGKPGYMHAKVIVADENRAWVGSVNGSISAVDRNREFGVFVTDAKNVMKLSSILESDFAISQEWQENLKCTSIP